MKSWVLLPTYKEEGHILPLIQDILRFSPQSQVLVVDDSAPDKTADIVGKLCLKDPRVHLLSRQGRRGRGSAGVEGFLFVLAAGADCVVEMDADFSHQPKYIPEMIDCLDGYDAVIASRCLPSAAVSGRPAHRDFISLLAKTFCRYLLGMRLSDPTSGYRCFSRKALEYIDWGKVISTGPSIVGEINMLLQARGVRIKEIPIVFLERRHGSSKLNLGKLISTFCTLIKVRFSLRRLSAVASREI